MIAEDGPSTPSWLNGNKYVDFGNIEADLTAMEDYAKRLRTQVQVNYDPHVPDITNAMLTELPQPNAGFLELVGFMMTHHEAQNMAQQNVWYFSEGTNSFASAAHKISQEYRGSDAFADASVADVNKAMHDVANDAAQPSGQDF